jgi:PTH1 family peptidyl-tRNA hydrolase
MPFLIVGLGNPGKEYVLTRHNVGFMAVDMLSHAYSSGPFKNKDGALMAEANINSHKVILCKPMTYMNNSGIPVSSVASFYKIPLGNILVIHDEIDIPFSSMKAKSGGGNGGHNGLKSLDSHIGKDYWRLRVGIGHPGDKDMVSSYVLGQFNSHEQKQLVQILVGIDEIVSLFLAGKSDEFIKTASCFKPN